MFDDNTPTSVLFNTSVGLADYSHAMEAQFRIESGEATHRDRLLVRELLGRLFRQQLLPGRAEAPR